MLFAMQSGERKRRIQASELGTYLYCARALGYRRAGAPSENRAQMEAGFVSFFVAFLEEKIGRAHV